MVVFMFQEQFAAKVSDGSKPHTIRKKSKRTVRVGDVLSLRKWSGEPYRSKQVILREEVCTGVDLLNIDEFGNVSVCGSLLSRIEVMKLAKDDGFDDLGAMLNWFINTHGLPFEGVLIQWESK